MAAFALIGRIDPFDETAESWGSYVERLEQYFEANDVENSKRVSSLLTLIGGKTYSLVRDLTFPEKPSEKTYQQLVQLLNKHLSPKPLIIAERYRFYKRDQKEGETVNEYAAQLRKLTNYCEFNAFLNDALRDKIVCGLRNVHIQKRLLSEAELTLTKTIEVSVAMETAAKDAIELQGNTSHVNKIKTTKSKQTVKFTSDKQCYRCNGKGHNPHNCKFKEAVCHGCNKKGHIVKACRSSSKPQFKKKSKSVHWTGENSESESEGEVIIGTLQVNSVENKSKAIFVEPKVEGVNLSMELDTGSAVSVIAKDEFLSNFPHRKKLKKTKLLLKTYTGEDLIPLGVANVNVQYRDKCYELPLYVVEKGGHALFGRDWLREIPLDWTSIKSIAAHKKETVKQNVQLDAVLKKHPAVFEKKLGEVKGVTAKFKVQENCQPKYIKARTVAYSLRNKVENELDRLVNEGTLTKVSHSDWATPIVPVMKKNGEIRICGDFRVTVNPVLKVDQYPLPKIEDIFAKLAGGQQFTKLDLTQAYLHLPVHESSKELVTINTHKGLYRYNRMPFGIASAPAIWQRTIEEVLQGIPGVQVMLDDMIITGKDNQEHLNNLEKVLSRLEEYGLRLNLEKSEFFKDSVTFCGHIIDKEGLHKIPDKIQAITNAPQPENVSQLKSFLGLVNYYGKFLPDLATVLNPLHRLLHKGQQWKWDQNCEDAFRKVKQLVTSKQVLTHYDPEKPIKLACDASAYGIGAVISHICEGQEKPIAFASRTLNQAEKNYAQIDKEALGLIWGIKKFHSYLYGRKIILETDHQPLVHIFKPEKGLSSTASARIQRYSTFLAGYDYEIVFRKTDKHSNADALSRLPLKNFEQEVDNDEPINVFHIEQIEHLPVSNRDIQVETRKDKNLALAYDFTLNGWPQAYKDGELAPFYARRDELTVSQGCLMWGIRVVIPTKLRTDVLSQIHEGHLGVVKMKSFARSLVWWPGIDKDIETLAKKCEGCQENRNMPPGAPFVPWDWPSQPWERIHIDFAGPFLGSMFLIVVDAMSKWPEVIQMSKTTATHTIEVLRTIFARNGLPSRVVSDNGPQFTSSEFQQFMDINGIKHIKTTPYHPSSNGLAERFVQSFKQAMRASKKDSGTISKKLAKFLLAYRSTPHQTTNETPSMLMMGRELKTRLHNIKPNIKNRVLSKQEEMCNRRKYHNRNFESGQSVVIRDYRHDKVKWTPGTIKEKTGPVSYRVTTDNGGEWRRHADQILDSNISSDNVIEPNIATENESTQHAQRTMTTPSPPKEHVQPEPLIQHVSVNHRGN